MATKSFLKNVTIKGRRNTNQFLRAMEKAVHSNVKEVRLDRNVRRLEAKDIPNFFKDL